MAVTVKGIGLWRSEVANEPGALARTLEPLAASRASLRVVMGYRFPEHQERAAIEVYPVAGARVTAAAQAAGLAPSDLACLLVEARPSRARGSHWPRARRRQRQRCLRHRPGGGPALLGRDRFCRRGGRQFGDPPR